MPGCSSRGGRETAAAPGVIGASMNSAVAGRPPGVRRPPAVVVLVRGPVEVASWALAPRDAGGLSVVEDLARLQLAARRLGCRILLRSATRDVLELLDLVGLGGVVPGCPLRQVARKAEHREQAGVAEVVVPDDPVA